MDNNRSDQARWTRGDFKGGFRDQVGTMYYFADDVAVAKKWDGEWISLVDGWSVREGADIDGNTATAVAYDPDVFEFRTSHMTIKQIRAGR
jgi:hypothetical protein